MRELGAPLALALKRALASATQAVNEIAVFLNNTSSISNLTIIEPLTEGLGLAPSPVFTFRWPLAKGWPVTFPGRSTRVSGAAEFDAMPGGIQLHSGPVIQDTVVAIAMLLAATKRLISRCVESTHKAALRLLKWMADKTRSAVAYAGNSTATLTAGTGYALDLSITAARIARGINSARSVEHAAAVARLTPTLHAVRRVAAAAAFTAPLMLAGAAAAAYAAPPLSSTSDTARLAAPLSAQRMTQDSIVINYAPNVTIHSEDAADSAALKRRVMEVLERHGRELHQVLTREIVRQQRRDF